MSRTALVIGATGKELVNVLLADPDYTSVGYVLLDGITTISTDFRQMGILAATQIIDDTQSRVPVPFRLTLRNSL